MNEKDTAAWSAIGGLTILGLGVVFYANRHMLTVGTILMVIGFFAMIYCGYKYTQIGQENEKERTNTAMGLCTVCAIITILVCVLAVPGINEEVKEGGIVVPTYSATVIVTVDPDQILVGKDFTLYQDNKKIDSFHLRAWEQWQKTIEVKWTMDPIGETTFKVTSSGAEGLGDGTDSKTIRMTDGQIYRITLRA